MATRIAIVGATGPTGRTLAAELARRRLPIRVVSRRAEILQAQFPDPGVQKRAGDAMDYGSIAAALEGCEPVVDCIGLPGGRMADHPVTAQNLARFIRESGARGLQVSSYWSFMPIGRSPVSETSRREGGPPWARFRREAEDLLRDAGAAIVHLPDFFGPLVHTSILQLALLDAVKGKTINWIGPADVPRDQIYVPDAMRIVADLLSRDEAYGQAWVVPGSGPITAKRLASLLGPLLGRRVRVRATPAAVLRVLSLLSKDLRGLMQIVPEYVKPISFDGAKLERLVGPSARTSYEDALGAAIRSLRA